MQFKPRFLLLIVLLFAVTGAWAQVCNGSLGDVIVKEDFGSGSTQHFPSTTYTYAPGSCPNDGSYSLSKTETGCHDDTWLRVLSDHTGNDGYMMVVNASIDRGEFFKYPLDAGVLCENTTYEFSSYILNLIKAGQSGFIKPNISFIIETPDGVLIKKQDTDDIPETFDPNGWVKYGTFFTTPPGVTSVVIKMVNNAPGGTGNDLLLDDIAFRACGPIVQAGIAGDITATQTNLCVGTSTTYTIQAAPPTGYANAKYQWQKSTDNGVTWIDMPGEENRTLIQAFPANSPIGSYQYRLGVADGGNITSLNCRVYSNAVIIDITGYPTPPALAPASVCEGDTRMLTASGGATYKWTLPNGTESSANPLIIQNATAADAGRYHVEVISAAGCSTPQDVDVTVNLKPVIDISPNPLVCRGNSTQLAASVAIAGSYTYSWFPVTGLSDANIANPVANPNNTTLYTVTVTNSITNCVNTAQVEVDVLDMPVANAGTDKKIFEGQSIELDGSATGEIQSYSWSPPDYLDDPHSPTPIATPPHDQPYLLTVTSANGCGISTDDVFVRVYEKIVIPSTFTPNNDGFNDIWNIEALETYAQSVISVFTRNGKQVFQSRGYGKPWDGKLNGSPLPAGTYYYVIDLKNDTPKLSGWVLLVR
jgi:gliding motility-associated-like protein